MHHDRLKPYYPRTGEENDTSWVDNVIRAREPVVDVNPGVPVGSFNASNVVPEVVREVENMEVDVNVGSEVLTDVPVEMERMSEDLNSNERGARKRVRVRVVDESEEEIKRPRRGKRSSRDSCNVQSEISLDPLTERDVRDVTESETTFQRRVPIAPLVKRVRRKPQRFGDPVPK
mgnify:CR=1 FL=1